MRTGEEPEPLQREGVCKDPGPTREVHLSVHPKFIASSYRALQVNDPLHKLALPPVWIEHYPKEATDGASEAFELVVFSSYEVKERAPYMGEVRLTVGEPTWKKLDRESVEALVGQEV
jgi:hypothetical protein